MPKIDAGARLWWATAPLWRKELHAWTSALHHPAPITLPRKVDRSLSLLIEDLLPHGLEALRAPRGEKCDLG
jgi:hypothetical protein